VFSSTNRKENIEINKSTKKLLRRITAFDQRRNTLNFLPPLKIMRATSQLKEKRKKKKEKRKKKKEKIFYSIFHMSTHGLCTHPNY
jgi:hypothetical protein